jgi:hypothetical protein
MCRAMADPCSSGVELMSRSAITLAASSLAEPTNTMPSASAAMHAASKACGLAGPDSVWMYGVNRLATSSRAEPAGGQREGGGVRRERGERGEQQQRTRRATASAGSKAGRLTAAAGARGQHAWLFASRSSTHGAAGNLAANLAPPLGCAHTHLRTRGRAPAARRSSCWGLQRSTGTQASCEGLSSEGRECSGKRGRGRGVGWCFSAGAAWGCRCRRPTADG